MAVWTFFYEAYQWTRPTIEHKNFFHCHHEANRYKADKWSINVGLPRFYLIKQHSTLPRTLIQWQRHKNAWLIPFFMLFCCPVWALVLSIQQVDGSAREHNNGTKIQLVDLPSMFCANIKWLIGWVTVWPTCWVENLESLTFFQFFFIFNQKKFQPICDPTWQNL